MEKKVVVIAGPSGSGKNTLIREIRSRFPNAGCLTTMTTRTPRFGERDGEDYYFRSTEEFDRAVQHGDIAGQRFVNLFGGIHYGIYLPDLAAKLEKHSVVFAPVDIAGAEWLKAHYGALTIFIVPQSFEQYKTRLRQRSHDMSEREFEARMKIAHEEFTMHAPRYDHTVVSMDGGLPETAERVLEILKKEGYTL